MKIAAGALIGFLFWPGFGSTLISAGAAETETSRRDRPCTRDNKSIRSTVPSVTVLKGTAMVLLPQCFASDRATLEPAYSSSALPLQDHCPRTTICCVPLLKESAGLAWSVVPISVTTIEAQ